MTTKNPLVCDSPDKAYIGNGECDDSNNNEACGYDGGDCCGKNVNTDYCIFCQCLDPKEQPF